MLLKKPQFEKADGNFFRITSEMVYAWGGTKLTVPVGFLTDLASIPRPFRNLISRTGMHVEAAILHDFLYSQLAPKTISRKVADGIFLGAMKELGVSWFVRSAMYQAVRVGGWTHPKWRLRK